MGRPAFRLLAGNFGSGSLGWCHSAVSLLYIQGRVEVVAPTISYINLLQLVPQDGVEITGRESSL